jgi:hypothetical protein
LPVDFKEDYLAREARWSSVHDKQQRLYRQIGNARLATGILAVVIAAISIGVHWISLWWLAAPVAVFIALAIRIDRVETLMKQAARGAAFYERALARVENRWIGKGNDGRRFLDPKHVYADDLDLFGRGSLFELLSTARTGAGEQTLASWLLAPAGPEELISRQKAVAELRPRMELREELALMGDDIRSAVDDRALSAWGTMPRAHFFPWARAVAFFLSIAAAVTGLGALFQFTTLRPFLYVVLAEIIFTYFVRESVGRVLVSVNLPAAELQLVGSLLERLEREAFSAPALEALRSKLVTEGKRATVQIRRLERLVDSLDWARNQMFRVIAGPLLWTPQFTMAIEEWRAHCGSHIGEWIAAVGEFEALGSLACFAYERPFSVFPEIVEGSEPVFEAEELVHPLIPPGEAIANSVSLGGAKPLWIVSGSNMSGKSTLLRAVGLNTVLALAGAPVTAKRTRVSRLNIGASLRANDSLTDHKSRFYAEISRLRDVMDLARSGRATLFLLDELLSGTNSQDRRVGAEAIIRGLVERGAIGMVTTHDLALAEIEEQMDGRAVNVHFEDQLESGQIRFDYKLRAGVVRRGNALELMRAVGLDV